MFLISVMSPSPDSTALSAALELRPLRLSELLDRMFQLYRRYFVPLFLLAAIIYSFNFVINLASEYLQGGRSLNQTLHLLEQLQHGQKPMEAGPHLSVTLAALALGLVSMLFLQVGTGVLCFYASDLYLGRLTPLRTCLHVLRQKMVTIALCSLLKWTFITLAFVPCLLAIGSFVVLAGKLNLWSGLLLLGVIILLAAPGFILIVRFLLTTPLIVLENEGVWGSLRRSSEMARYNPGLGFWYWGATRLSLVFLVVVVIKLLQSHPASAESLGASRLFVPRHDSHPPPQLSGRCRPGPALHHRPAGLLL
jgi:hypothetical protein